MDDQIAQVKNKIIPILKEAGVTKSAFFGSFSRGESTAESDIDILVELPKGASLFDLAGLKIQLEDELDKKIDLITYNSIHPLMKKYILDGQIQIL